MKTKANIFIYIYIIEEGIEKRKENKTEAYN